jgi:flagellar basal body-associated protein FliL
VPVRRESQAKPKKKSPLRTWLVIVAILLAAAAAGVVVAMSGPDVAVHHGK